MDDKEQASVAAKQRMANFRFRQSPTTTVFSDAPSSPQAVASSTNKAHARSHSRNNSISNLPLKLSSMNNAITSDELQDVPSSPTPRSRPNSHHRRRSSVSTRRESAEMMGFAPPPETGPDSSDEPAELRRLALRTLEGNSRSDNPFIGGFTKVEIPELETIENDTLKLKPALPPFGMGSSLAGKRDSFGKLLLASNSIKDQLQTLLEEEEEEEQEWEDSKPSIGSEEAQKADKEETVQLPTTPCSDIVQEPFQEDSIYPLPAPQPNRHRPTNLVLRPLSLTPNSLPLSRVVDSLPTPAMTPSPRPGLKTLTLGSSPSSSISSVSSTSSMKRQSLSVSPSPRPFIPERRLSVGDYATPPQRKSSISYKRSDAREQALHLPTPDATPTTAVPPLHAKLPSIPKVPSSSTTLPDLDRPLSPTEQAFLFRSHTSLLCRISELEAAIADGRGRQPSPLGFDRSRSPVHGRFLSIASTSSMSDVESVSSQPSDELLQLVSDLKAERDELMRDVEGWRTRVSDLDKQIGILNRRVEAERREGWVVRERLGVIEVEKKRVREDLERERLENRRLEKALLTEETARKYAEDERDSFVQTLQDERERRESAEHEIERLQAELAQMRERAESLEADLHAAITTPKIPISMHRLDDSTSTTDVEEYIPLGMRSLKLNSVSEEPEDHDLPQSIRSDSECGDDESDNDELAHYEDDDGLEDDMMFDDDHTSSSFGSMGRTNSHLLRLDLSAVAPVPAPVTPSHIRTGSMERGWSFPQSQVSPAGREPPKVDRFFECLDALDNEAESDSDAPVYDTATARQFWRGAIMDTEEDEDDLPPFVLPAQPNASKKLWIEAEAAKLEAVAEEEEEEDDMFSPTTPKPFTTRKMSMDLKIPAFTPQVGIAVLKAPPPPKRATEAFPTSVLDSYPKDSYTGLASSPSSSSSITPPANRASSITGSAPPSLIPRLSISPKTHSTGPNLSPPMTSPTPTTPSRIPTASKSLMSPLKNRTPVPTPKTNAVTTTPMPMFIPQPKVISRPLPLLRA